MTDETINIITDPNVLRRHVKVIIKQVKKDDNPQIDIIGEEPIGTEEEPIIKFQTDNDLWKSYSLIMNGFYNEEFWNTEYYLNPQGNLEKISHRLKRAGFHDYKDFNTERLERKELLSSYFETYARNIMETDEGIEQYDVFKERIAAGPKEGGGASAAAGGGGGASAAAGGGGGGGASAMEAEAAVPPRPPSPLLLAKKVGPEFKFPGTPGGSGTAGSSHSKAARPREGNGGHPPEEYEISWPPAQRTGGKSARRATKKQRFKRTRRNNRKRKTRRSSKRK